MAPPPATVAACPNRPMAYCAGSGAGNEAGVATLGPPESYTRQIFRLELSVACVLKKVAARVVVQLDNTRQNPDPP